MKKLLKKLAKCAICAVICVSVLTPGAIFANNATAGYTFSVALSGSGYVSTAGRAKDNASQVFINCTSVSSSTGAYSATFYVTPYGKKSTDSSFRNMTYTQNGVTYSAPTYVLKRGESKYMTNYIYQAGGRLANVYCNTTVAYVTFKGVWSADSY